MLWVLLAVGTAALLGCSERESTPRFKSTDITGSSIGGDFTMPDFTGKPRTLSEFRGKLVVIFFGFLQCPDVCPTTLSEAAAALKELGPKADEVQIIFITVDPERDTPELLQQYVTAFHPKFLGLRGNQAELEAGSKVVQGLLRQEPKPQRWVQHGPYGRPVRAGQAGAAAAIGLSTGRDRPCSHMILTNC